MKKFLKPIALAGIVVLGKVYGLVVEVKPNPATVVPGGSIRFSVEVKDSIGNVVSPDDIKWVVVPKRIGKISKEGLFLASRERGAGIVRALVKVGEEKGVGHAVVKIKKSEENQGTLVKVVPRRSFVKIGGKKEFKVKFFGPDGGEIENPELTFKVVPKEMGTITQDGVFQAGNEYGRVNIIVLAKKGELEGVGRALVIIGHPGRYLPVKIIPKHAIVEPNERIKFKFEILGAKPEGEVKVKWEVTPKEMGIITQDGGFQAGEKRGRCFVRVIVKAGEKVGTDRAIVIIGKPKKFRVRIFPKQIAIRPMDEVKFYAEVRDREGNIVDLPVEWRVKPKEKGKIDPTGLFKAGTEVGRCQVIAVIPPRFGIGRDIAQVIIHRLLRVKIKPKHAQVEVNGTFQFEVEVKDRTGNIVDIPIEWIVRPPVMGKIDENGLFTAGSKPGVAQVVARIPLRFGIGRDVAFVKIGKPREVKVKISPKRAIIKVKERLQFKAEAFDENGNPISDAKFIWRVIPRTLGKIDDKGLFQAGPRAGRGKVIAIIHPSIGIGKDEAVIGVVKRE
jgi:hypothetical protein